MRLLLMCVCLALAESIERIAALPRVSVDSSTTRFIDDSGREVYFRGVNAVVKGPPWLPSRDEFNANHSLVEQDFQILSDIGVNTLRLGVMWAALEPAPGQYNLTYLEQLKSVVHDAAAYGIYTLLDFHQDLWSEAYCGEGMPSWALNVTATAQEFPRPARGVWANHEFDPATGFPTRKACASMAGKEGLGFAELYFADAIGLSFQGLYKNQSGVLQAWSDAWAQVVESFTLEDGRLDTAILGIELINEPFAGDVLRHPTLLGPGTADTTNLAPAYDVLTEQLLKVSPDLLVFYAGLTWGRWGSGFTHAPAHKANHTVMAFHYYKPLDNLWLPAAIEQFKQDGQDMSTLGSGGMVTEMFGPSCDSSYTKTAELAESYLQSYVLWQYKLFCQEDEESLKRISQHAQFGACKTGGGCGFFDIDGVPIKGAFEAVARPYPVAVAGRLQYSRFQAADYPQSFEMRYAVTSTSVSTIFVPTKYTYASGYRVKILPSGVASYSRAANSSLLQIQVFQNVTIGQDVTIQIRSL